MSQKSMRSMAIVLLAALVVGGTCLMILDVAGAKPAKAAAVTDFDVSLTGDENDGNYFWEGQKEAWEKDADALFVKFGQAKIFFVWPPNNGSHDVKLRKSQSTPGVTFPVSTLHQNYGTEDERWPASGWKPTKPGTYALYCSKHTGMKMRVIVQASAAKRALSVAVRAPRRSVSVGSRVKLIATLKALGRTSVSGVSLCVNLPSNVKYRSSSGKHSGGRVCWRIGTLKAGKSRSFAIDGIASGAGRRQATASARGSGTNRATSRAGVSVHSFTG